jgi:Ca2+-binding RTX toxin-like protein
VLTIGATAGVTVNLNLAGLQNTGGAGFDQLVSIENLIGSNFNDTLIGNGGSNVLNGQGGNDCLFGNAGNDQLLGGSGNDTLNGGLGNDLLNGGIGIDTVDYSNKVVCGTTYSGATAGVRVNLNVQGIAQNTGGAGSDTLVSIENVTGSNFSDTLTGNAGNNVLSGLAGNDLLAGGASRDLLTGGGGTLAFDTFDYNAASDSLPGAFRDVITDFNGRGALVGDRIDLSTIDANPFLAGNQTFIWTGAAPGGLGRAWYSGGILRANTDFDVAPELEIQLVGAPALFVLAGHPGSDVLL